MKPGFSEITECRALTRCNINYVLLPLKYLRAFPPVAFRTHKSSKKFLCCNFLQTGGFSLNYKQFHFPFEYLSNRTRTYCCSLIYIYAYIYIYIYIYIYLKSNLTYVRQCSIHRSRAMYILWEEKDK